MLLPEEYHEELLSHFGEKEISLTDLIEAVIILYPEHYFDRRNERYGIRH